MSQAQLTWYLELSGTAVFFGSILLAGGIMAALDRSVDSYIQPAPEGKMRFRKPLSKRMPMALFALSFFGGALAFAGICFDPMTIGGGVWSLPLPLMMCLAPAVWLLGKAGPDELDFNIADHTFHRTSGWPLYPKSFSGTWNQIFGIYVRHISGTSSNKPYYLVGFYWTSGRGVSVIGEYRSREDAETEAERLSAALGLRRVGAPR